jgi:hypothetical protein
MTRRTLYRTRFALLLVVALSMGLHYAVVQMVAWVNMTVEYSQTMPMSEALVMTFDGKHPCELCKLVEKELGNSESDGKSTPEKKQELKFPPVISWVDGIPLLCGSFEFLFTVESDDRARFRRERPPLPPPRDEMICLS